MVPRESRLQCGRHGAVQDRVPVGSLQGVVACVELIRYLLRAENADIPRKSMVDRLEESVEWDGRARSVVGDLPTCMNSRIGSSGGDESDLFADGPAQDAFDDGLNPKGIGLGLPTGVVGPVVFDGQLDVAGRLVLGVNCFRSSMPGSIIASSGTCGNDERHILWGFWHTKTG